jgi:lipopolysaccharide transport system permease protein
MVWWKVIPGAGLWIFPVAMAGLLACGAALGLAIAPLGTLYGDVTKALPILTSFWMLLTPVVYPPRTEGLAGFLATWNPVAPLVTTARQALTNVPFTQLPEFAVVFAVSLLVALLGLIGFRLAMPHLIARMGG